MSAVETWRQSSSKTYHRPMSNLSVNRILRIKPRKADCLKLQEYPHKVKFLQTGFPENRLSSVQTLQPMHTKPATDRENKVRTAKLQPVFAAAVCAVGSDERHVREIAAQIDPEKHHRHGHLLAARGRGLRFCRPMVRAGQARRLLAESSVPGAVRGDGPFIRY